MRRLIILSMILFTSVSISAKESTINPNRNFFTYSYDNAVYFVERGIKFNVFLNGDFDFSTRRNLAVYNRNRYGFDRNVRISRDFDGRIRSIGNVTVRYDIWGNVRRIGTVRMNYFRGRLTKVGNLSIRYDRWGYPRFFGNVNSFRNTRFNGNIGNVYFYNDPFFFNANFRRNYTKFREDRNFFYYKARPNARVENGKRIIKRRKTESTRRNNNQFEKEHSYRKSEIKKRTTNDGRKRRR